MTGVGDWLKSQGVPGDAEDLARLLYLVDHVVDSGSNFAKILSPKPVDKFVDNLKKNIMPY